MRGHLLPLGMWTGYGPLHHYLHGGVEVSCPWAPVHGHAILLGWIGLTVFGLVYRALPDWGALKPWVPKAAAVHLWLAVASVLGVLVNGIFGYQILNRVSPGFYYALRGQTLTLWFMIDGLFLSLFAVSGLLFVWVLFGGTRESRGASPSESTPPAA